MKPLGRKSYGGIPHLPASRMGPGDHHCHDGQARIATVAVRDRHDLVIVQEKLDGSNVAVAKQNGTIWPLTRAGYHANSSPYPQHHEFARWVALNWPLFNDLLTDGERVCGEWLFQAHGTRYTLPHEPFVAFDIMTADRRLPYEQAEARLRGKLPMPHVVSIGPSVSVEAALKQLGDYGHHGAIDPIEGAVWRVERKGEVDFLVKYVRPDKADGCYLESVSGGPTVLNSFPSRPSAIG